MKKLQVEDILEYVYGSSCLDYDDYVKRNTPNAEIIHTMGTFTQAYYAINDPIILIWLYHQSNDTGDAGALVQAVANCANMLIDLVPFASCRDSITAAVNYKDDADSFFGIPYAEIFERAASEPIRTEHSKNIIVFASGATGFVNGDDWYPHHVIEYALKAYGYSGVMNYDSAAYYKRYYEMKAAFCNVIRECLPLELWNMREPIA